MSNGLTGITSISRPHRCFQTFCLIRPSIRTVWVCANSAPHSSVELLHLFQCLCLYKKYMGNSQHNLKPCLQPSKEAAQEL